MNESLRPVIDSKLEEIRDLLEKRELWSVMYANDSKIKKYEDRISELESSREKDADTDEKDESVGKDIKMAVYDNLATTRKDYQVIIFENEEPTKDLKNKINYIHFTGNDNVDRQGFITD